MTATNEYREAVGEWIRRQRLALEVPQSTLADAIGFSEASVSRWELGQGTINSLAHHRLKTYFRDRWAARLAQVEQAEVAE